MAINPALINTVQVKDLPPNPISLTDNFVHEVGNTLSRSTIQELVDFIRSQSSAQPFEIKYVRAPDYQYILDNFDMTPGATQGLGIVGGLWEGWAIFNGNNGTDNLDGQTLIGFGANYATVGQFVGSADAVVVEHSHKIGDQSGSSGSGTTNVRYIGKEIESNSLGIPYTDTTGVSGVGKNIQPSMVILMIMKLP